MKKQTFIAVIVPVLFAVILGTGCSRESMTLQERLATLPADTLFRIDADTSFSEAWEIRRQAGGG